MALLAGARTDISSLHAATDTGETWNVIQEVQFELQICEFEGCSDAKALHMGLKYYKTVF